MRFSAQLLFANPLARVALLAFHHVGLAFGRVAVGRIDVLAVQLAVLHGKGSDRNDRQGKRIDFSDKGGKWRMLAPPPKSQPWRYATIRAVSDQSHIARHQRRLGTRADVELAVDVLHIADHGV